MEPTKKLTPCEVNKDLMRVVKDSVKSDLAFDGTVGNVKCYLAEMPIDLLYEAMAFAMAVYLYGVREINKFVRCDD